MYWGRRYWAGAYWGAYWGGVESSAGVPTDNTTAVIIERGTGASPSGGGTGAIISYSGTEAQR